MEQPLQSAIRQHPTSTYGVLGTSLHVTTYARLVSELQAICTKSEPVAVDFTNTQIVTLRRQQPCFRATTVCFDYFIPDGMPLIWCLNFQGARLKDRVYGPTFMRHCVLANPGQFSHYLLGGSEACLRQLRGRFLSLNSDIQILGFRNGFFSAAEEGEIVEEINRLSPDFIWVGLGTPKQQDWINRNKRKISRGIILAVGFAFDVNAGTKSDAPIWMQRCGLTWVFRLLSEPRRLGPRYLRSNFWFLAYLLWDGIRGRAWCLEV